MKLDQIYLVSPKKEMVDPVELKDLEGRLKIKLPDDYCEFLIRFEVSFAAVYVISMLTICLKDRRVIKVFFVNFISGTQKPLPCPNKK